MILLAGCIPLLRQKSIYFWYKNESSICGTFAYLRSVFSGGTTANHPSFFTQNKTVFERILYSSSVRFTNSDSVKSSLSNNRLIPDITRLKMPGSSFFSLSGSFLSRFYFAIVTSKGKIIHLLKKATFASVSLGKELVLNMNLHV